jgi:cytochrome P450
MLFAMLEARLLLATILQHFVPDLAPGVVVAPIALVTLIPRYGLPMVLRKASPPVQAERIAAFSQQAL